MGGFEKELSARVLTHWNQMGFLTGKLPSLGMHFMSPEGMVMLWGCYSDTYLG